MTKTTDKFEGLRVYIVVPGTVQTPIKITYDSKHNIYSAGRFENTRDIIQPAGRQAIQIGHVRGMVEHYLVLQDVQKLLRMKTGVDAAARVQHVIPVINLRNLLPYHAITGIAKACRDSFELIHVKKLLEDRGVKVFEFHDTQEGLYEDVVTALATEPVTPFDVNGALDYLPLWTGE